MYTLEQLQQKTLNELKDIGWELNVLPEGDRRCRRNWIDALVGKNPPLLQLLETSPGVEVDRVQEPIEIQRQEPIEVQVQEPIEIQAQEPIEVQAQEPIESKFGRIVYPKLAAEPIALAAENFPGVSFDVDEFRQTHAVEIESYFQSFNDEQPPNRGDGRGRLESELKVSQSAIGFPVTFSPRFLETYPPYFGEIHYKADCTGQLNLLEPETDDEPPDPDDFESLDAFREAIALWDAENLESLAVSMDSMCEWAPCPADWYEPEAEKLPLKASSMRENSEVSELSPTAKSFNTYNFSIPTFDIWCDRANRQNDTGEPPDTGIFAKLPKPKPPSFPPRAIDLHDSYINSAQTQTYCMTAAGSSHAGRSPPGGDAVQS